MIFSAYLKQYAGVSNACWQRIVISFIFSITRGLFFFLSFYFVKDLHMSIATAGLAVSCYGLGAAIGSFIGGHLSDHFSPETVSVISLILNAIILFCLPAITHTNMIMLISFLWAAFSYSFLTSNHAWILEHTHLHETERLKVLNILYAAANLGIFVSAGIVGFSAIYGFDTIFIASGIALVFVVGFLLLTAHYHKSHIIGCIDTFVSDEFLAEKQANPNAGNAVVLWLGIICLFFVSLIVTQKSTVYTIYLSDAFPHLKVKGVSFLFALNPILVVLFQTPVVNWFRHKNKIVAMGIGAILMGIGMVMLPFFPIFIMVVIAAAIYTFGEMIFTVINELAIYQSFKAGKKGQALGTFRSVYALSMIAGPALAGYLYERFGGNSVWYLSMAIGMVFFIICYMLRHHYRLKSSDK